MEGSKAGTNKRSPGGVSHPNQNITMINKKLQNFIRYVKSAMKFS